MYFCAHNLPIADPKGFHGTPVSPELRTSASTVAIMHVCQLQYQEFDACMRYYKKHVTTIETMSEESKQIKELIHALLPLQLGMAICNQYENAYFPRITSCFAASAARSGVTPLVVFCKNNNQV